MTREAVEGPIAALRRPVSWPAATGCSSGHRFQLPDRRPRAPAWLAAPDRLCERGRQATRAAIPPPPPPIGRREPPQPPSLLVMVAIVADVVALVILVFSGLGYFLGKFIF